MNNTVVCNNTKEEYNKNMFELISKIPNMKEFLGEFFMEKSSEKAIKNAIITKLLSSDSDDLRWIGFKLSNPGKKCFWDKNSGNMTAEN